MRGRGLAREVPLRDAHGGLGGVAGDQVVTALGQGRCQGACATGRLKSAAITPVGQGGQQQGLLALLVPSRVHLPRIPVSLVQLFEVVEAVAHR